MVSYREWLIKGLFHKKPSEKQEALRKAINDMVLRGNRKALNSLKEIAELNQDEYDAEDLRLVDAGIYALESKSAVEALRKSKREAELTEFFTWLAKRNPELSGEELAVLGIEVQKKLHEMEIQK